MVYSFQVDLSVPRQSRKCWLSKYSIGCVLQVSLPVPRQSSSKAER